MGDQSAGDSRRPAIFLDRDGTLNEDVGYAAHPAEIAIYPYTAEAIRLINEAGWKAIVITNQSGIARGYLDEAMLARIHEHLRHELARQGARLDGFYYCPHHPRIGVEPYRQTCHCRKPQTGMLEQAASEHNINLADSFVIGDKASDINLATNAGARGVLVKTGYGGMTLQRVQNVGTTVSQNDQVAHACAPYLVADNLLDAVRLILREVSADRGA